MASSSQLLQEIIVAAEKAAGVARACRHNKHLFGLLVERKGRNEANPRFVADFKTLADVLIQEMVRHDIGGKFPEMKNSIKGEESNTFSNTLGETICVEIKDTVDQTANLLNKVLCGDTTAAHLLALEVHQDMQLEDVDVSGVVDGVKIDFSKVGIWIDPIDSTAEYINGTEEPNNEHIAKTGLKCVTVLIGAYCLKTGLPLAGVINQPFSFKNENNWFGRSYISSLPNKSNNTICVSTSEDEAVKTKLTSAGFILVEAAGAGYKLLAVATGLADAYVLSKNSTFKWDTCAPHAVLQAAGGDILVYSCALRGELLSVNYLTGEGDKMTQCCNHGGIIAYRSKRSLKKILDALKM